MSAKMMILALSVFLPSFVSRAQTPEDDFKNKIRTCATNDAVCVGEKLIDAMSYYTKQSPKTGRTYCSCINDMQYNQQYIFRFINGDETKTSDVLLNRTTNPECKIYDWGGCLADLCEKLKNNCQ